MNPARTLGPAIFSAPSISNVYTYLIYFLGPLLGATFAVILFKYFNETEDDLLEEDFDDDEILEEVEIIEEVIVPVKARKPVTRKKAQKES